MRILAGLLFLGLVQGAWADCPTSAELAELFNDWAIDGNEVALRTLLTQNPGDLDAKAKAQWVRDLAMIAQRTRDPATAERAEALFRAQLSAPEKEVRHEALLGLVDLVRHTRGEGGRFEALAIAFKAETDAWIRVAAAYRIEFMLKAEIGLARGARPGSGTFIVWGGVFAADVLVHDPDARVRRKALSILDFISR